MNTSLMIILDVAIYYYSGTLLKRAQIIKPSYNKVVLLGPAFDITWFSYPI